VSRSPAAIEQAFAAALLDPERPVPDGVLGRAAGPNPRRFAIYRNNIVAGLMQALRHRFAVSERLVGEDFFRAMARDYIAGHRPRSPLLMTYGDDFPAFMEGFPPAADLPYLADVARLEVVWSQAYHAAEAASLEIDALRGLAAQDLIAARLMLHPSLRLLRSLHPVAGIWAAHQSEGEVVGPDRWEAQDVLVLRAETQVLVHRLAPGRYAFLNALLAADTIEEAGEAALSEAPEFDLGSCLIGLLSVGAVVDFILGSASREPPTQ
jgi:hypothetical protein